MSSLTGGRIVTRLSTHLGAPTLDRIDACRFKGPTGSYAPTKRVSAIGVKSSADKALPVAAFHDRGACSIAPEKDAWIVWVAEPVNHIHTDQEDGLHRCICGDQSSSDGDLRRKGRAGTIDVKCAGILCAEFVLQDDCRVRRDTVRGTSCRE